MRVYQPFLALLLSVALGTTANCGVRKPKGPITPVPVKLGQRQTGVASWYGHPYHGRITSNGEVYDMELMTAAHPNWAFDTWVKVTNLQNGNDVTVRINDRGPFIKNRIIDLSRAAARQIGMLAPGTARVRVEVVQGRPANQPKPPRPERQPKQPSTPVTTAPVDRSAEIRRRLRRQAAGACPSGPYWAVQIGAFEEEINAERMLGKARERYGAALQLEVMSEGRRLYRVVLGPAESANGAQRLAALVQEEGAAAFARQVGGAEAGGCTASLSD